MMLTTTVTVLFCVLCAVCAHDVEELELEHLPAKMDAMSDKLDRQHTVNQQIMLHMSSVLEHVTSLLRRVEMCGPCDATTTTTTTTTPAPSNPPAAAALDDSWRDEVAQGACTGMQQTGGWMFAVRRECGTSRTCANICAGLAAEDSQVTRFRCVDSLHVYKGTHPIERDLTELDTETLGTKVFRYFTCAGSGCGPNFCCCQGA